jgi:hypothetical protein
MQARSEDEGFLIIANYPYFLEGNKRPNGKLWS